MELIEMLETVRNNSTYLEESIIDNCIGLVKDGRITEYYRLADVLKHHRTHFNLNDYIDDIYANCLDITKIVKEHLPEKESDIRGYHNIFTMLEHIVEFARGFAAKEVYKKLESLRKLQAE